MYRYFLILLLFVFGGSAFAVTQDVRIWVRDEYPADPTVLGSDVYNLNPVMTVSGVPDGNYFLNYELKDGSIGYYNVKVTGGTAVRNGGGYTYLNRTTASDKNTRVVFTGLHKTNPPYELVGYVVGHAVANLVEWRTSVDGAWVGINQSLDVPVSITADPPEAYLTFALNYVNASGESQEARIVIDGDVYNTSAVDEGAGTVDWSIAFADGTGGTWAIEVKNAAGEWVVASSGEYYATTGFEPPASGPHVAEASWAAPEPEPEPEPENPVPPAADVDPVPRAPDPPGGEGGSWTSPGQSAPSSTPIPREPVIGPAGSGPESEEMYQNFLNALKDAPKDTVEPPFEGGEISQLDPVDPSKLNDVSDAMEDLIQKRNDMVNALGGVLSKVPRIDEYVPRDLGRIYFVNLGKIGTFDLVFDFTPYESKINWIRELILFFLTLMFIFACLDLIGEYLFK